MDARDEERFNPAFKARQDAHRRARLEKQRKEIIADLSGEKLLDKPKRPQEKAVANIQPGQNRPQTSQPVRVVKPVPAATPPRAQRPVNRPVKPTLTKDVIRPVSQAERRDLGKAPAAPKGKAASAPAIKPVARQALPQRLVEAMVPWKERSISLPEFYAGKSETDAFNLADSIHNDIRNGVIPNRQAAISRLRNDLGWDPNNPSQMMEIDSFIDYARGDGKASQYSKSRAWGVPNAQGQERMWAAMMTESGNPTEMLNNGNPFATDLTITGGRFNGNNVDVQNILGEGYLNLGISHPRNAARRMFPNLGGITRQNALGSDSLRSLIQTYDNAIISRGEQPVADKFMQSGGTNVNSRFVAPDKEKRFLIGSRFQDSAAIGNETSMVREKGVRPPAPSNPYNPKLGTRPYAIDLKSFTEKVIDQPIGDLERQGIFINDGILRRGGEIVGQSNIDDLKMSIRLRDLDRFDGGTLDSLVTPDVRAMVQRIQKEQGYNLRNPNGYVNSDVFDPLAKGTKGLWKGRVGGLANVALNGASRETGKLIAKGDYKGAATEFGKNYAIGAAADVGIRKAGQAILTRLPAALAKGAATTAASGGWLAPAAALYTGYEVIDGVVEGTTGKTIKTHTEEQVDNKVADHFASRYGENWREGVKIKEPVKQKPWTDEQRMAASSYVQNLLKDSADKPQVQAPAPAQITAGPEPERKFGQKAVLNGKNVKWGGDNYGWQSEESFDTLDKPRKKFFGLF